MVQVESNRVALKVKDHGAGSPQNELKRIFKRFYRIPGTLAMRVKGTGLGLFIVSSIAKKHGGRAFAESAGTGPGSTFTLWLPSAPQKGRTPLSSKTNPTEPPAGASIYRGRATRSKSRQTGRGA